MLRYEFADDINTASCCLLATDTIDIKKIQYTENMCESNQVMFVRTAYHMNNHKRHVHACSIIRSYHKDV